MISYARLLALFVIAILSSTPDAAPAAVLACDETRPDTIEVVGQVDSLDTDVLGGELFSVTVVRLSGDAEFQPVWRVVDRFGRVFGPDFQDPGPHATRGPLPAVPQWRPYRIQVIDSNHDATGVYAVHLQKLTAGYTCETSLLACDEAVLDTIETALDTDLFAFTVSQGEAVSLSVVTAPGSPPGFDPVWRLLNAAGTEVVYGWGAHGAHRLTGPLPASGNPYRVEVADGGSDQAGYCTVRVQGLGVGTACADTLPLACDGTVTGTLEHAVDTDLLTFAAGDGEQVSITVMPGALVGVNFQPVWRVLDRAGTDLTNFVSGANVRIGPLPSAGSPYRVEVLDSGADDGGDYQARLQRLTAGHGCETSPLACDEAVLDTIETALDTDLHAFTVSQGEAVSLSVVTAPGSPPGFDPVWRLLNAAGTAVVYDWGAHGAHRLTGPLPASGNPYRVEVADGGSDGAGYYTVRVQGLGVGTACADTMPLVCDGTVTGTLEHAVDSDLLTFAAGDGEQVSITVMPGALVGVNFQPVWRVLDRAGTDLTNFVSGANVRIGPLPSAGSPYRVEVLDSGVDDSGDYQARLQRLTAGHGCETSPLACDEAVLDTIETALDTDLHAFTVSQGEAVSLSVVTAPGSPPGFDPVWRLLNAAGTAVVYDWGAHGAHRLTGPLPASGNPYRVEVADGGSDGAGYYTVRVQGLGVGTACADTMPLVCDGTVTGTLEHAVDSDLLTFAAGDGEQVSITVMPGALVGVNFQPVWRVLDRAGTDLTNFVSGANVRIGPLPSAGSPYRVEVLDSGVDDSGDYRAQLQRLTAGHVCGAQAVACGAAITSAIEQPLDTDLFEFSIDASMNAGIRVTEESPGGPDFNPAWRLLDRSGTPVGPCGALAERAGTTDCGSLLPTGNPHHIEVADAGQDDTGPYSVMVQCGYVGVDPRGPAAGGAIENHPNPFTVATRIAFDVPRQGRVAVRVFDLAGRVVSTLIDADLAAGRHAVTWEGRDGWGRSLESGVYVCEMSAGRSIARRYLVLVR